MRKKRSVLPSTDAKALPWNENFKKKIRANMVRLGYTEEEIVEVEKHCDAWIYWILVKQMQNQRSLDITKQSNDVIWGPTTDEIVTVNSWAGPDVPDALVRGGIAKWFRDFISNLKERDGYTESIGIDLDILSSRDEKDVNNDYPEVKSIHAFTDKVEVHVTLKAYKGFRVESRFEDTEWTEVAVNIGAFYNDKRKNRTHSPEGRYYRFLYVDNNEPIGYYSSVEYILCEIY